ncbi:uncharacterized protein METZ01_LOCUS170004, partial [marine metagenome]
TISKSGRFLYSLDLDELIPTTLNRLGLAFMRQGIWHYEGIPTTQDSQARIDFI